MPIESLILSTKFNDQLHNRESFALNADTVFAPNLIGSAMERIRLTQEILIKWYSEASAYNSFTFKDIGSNTFIITRQSGKWRSDGVSVGDSLTGSVRIDEGNVYAIGGVVTSVSESTMVITQNYGLAIPDGTYIEAVFYYTSDVNGLIYKFNIIENNEQANFESKVSGSEMGYYTGAIGNFPAGTRVDLQPLGKKRGWVTGSATVRQLGSSSVYEKKFEIRHEFIINPYYIEEYKQLFESGEIPDLYNGFNSLKYVNEIEFRTSLSDPESSKSVLIDNITGSVGWFNENFNGFNSEYKLNSITYKDDATGNVIDSINVSGRTNVAIVCEKLNGDFVPESRAVICMSALPFIEDYQETETDFVDNFLYDNVLAIADGGFRSGDKYIYSGNIVTFANTMTVTFSVEFSSLSQQYLLSFDDPEIMIGLMVGNHTLNLADSDKVMLLQDGGFSSMVNNVDLTGIATAGSFEIFDHAQDITSSIGTTSYEGWNEDGIVSKFIFNLDKSRNPLINSINQKVIAYNEITGDIIELDNTVISLQNTPIINGNQVIDINQTKAYKLIEGDQFNLLSLQGSDSEYTLISGQKITWQDWQKVLPSNVFLNANRKSSNYSEVNDYSIRLAFDVNITGLGTNGVAGTDNLLFISPEIKVYDYDEPDVFVGEIKNYKISSGLTDIGTSVLSNEPTLFTIEWEKTGVPITDITDFWAIHRIEVTGQNGMDIYEISTIRDFPINNPLQPDSGFLHLKMYIDNGKVITECLIDPRYLDLTNVNLSGRIRGAVQPLLNGKLQEDGSFKLAENGTIKLLDQ